MTMREEHARSDIRIHPVLITALVGFACWLVLAVGAVALGALVTHYVVGHAIGDGDLHIARWFAERRTETWNSVSLVGSHVADTVTVFVIVGIALLVLARRRAWSQFSLLSVAMAAEGATYLVATYFVSRNRPAVPRLEDLIRSDSYPSGHTAAAVALYGCLCIIVWSVTRNPWWRALVFMLVVLGPIVVAASRMYRGMHNPTDVVCGALIGAGCIAVAFVAVRTGVAVAVQRRGDEAVPGEQRRDEDEDEPSPVMLPSAEVSG